MPCVRKSGPDIPFFVATSVVVTINDNWFHCSHDWIATAFWKARASPLLPLRHCPRNDHRVWHIIRRYLSKYIRQPSPTASTRDASQPPQPPVPLHSPLVVAMPESTSAALRLVCPARQAALPVHRA